MYNPSPKEAAQEKLYNWIANRAKEVMEVFPGGKIEGNPTMAHIVLLNSMVNSLINLVSDLQFDILHQEAGPRITKPNTNKSN